MKDRGLDEANQRSITVLTLVKKWCLGPSYTVSLLVVLLSVSFEPTYQARLIISPLHSSCTSSSKIFFPSFLRSFFLSFFCPLFFFQGLAHWSIQSVSRDLSQTRNLSWLATARSEKSLKFPSNYCEAG